MTGQYSILIVVAMDTLCDEYVWRDILTWLRVPCDAGFCWASVVATDSIHSTLCVHLVFVPYLTTRHDNLWQGNMLSWCGCYGYGRTSACPSFRPRPEIDSNNSVARETLNWPDTSEPHLTNFASLRHLF